MLTDLKWLGIHWDEGEGRQRGQGRASLQAGAWAQMHIAANSGMAVALCPPAVAWRVHHVRATTAAASAVLAQARTAAARTAPTARASARRFTRSEGAPVVQLSAQSRAAVLV